MLNASTNPTDYNHLGSAHEAQKQRQFVICMHDYKLDNLLIFIFILIHCFYLSLKAVKVGLIRPFINNDLHVAYR